MHRELRRAARRAAAALKCGRVRVSSTVAGRVVAGERTAGGTRIRLQSALAGLALSTVCSTRRRRP